MNRAPHGQERPPAAPMRPAPGERTAGARRRRNALTAGAVCVAQHPNGSCLICTQLGRADRQHECLEQFDTGAAVHGPFERFVFQPIDLTLGLAVLQVSMIGLRTAARY